MSIASGDTPADPLTEGGDGTRRPPGEGGDGGAGVGGPGDVGPEQPVLEQVVGEPVLAAGVRTGPGAEAETQSDPMEPWWLRTNSVGPFTRVRARGVHRGPDGRARHEDRGPSATMVATRTTTTLGSPAPNGCR
jgi:hypothetical protein